MIEDAEFEAIAQEDIQCDLRLLFEGAVKVALEAMLEEEVRKLVGGIKWARLGNRREICARRLGWLFSGFSPDNSL